MIPLIKNKQKTPLCKTARQRPTSAISFVSAFALLLSLPTHAVTEEERAAENKKITGCYSRLAEEAYNIDNPEGTTVCASALTDPRNGMGEWRVADNQSQNNRNILTVYERESQDGLRREVAFGFRGSVSAGDWMRDGESQVFTGTAMQDTAVSKLKSEPSIDIVGSNPKFFRGFHERFINLSPEIAQKLDELEAWQRQNPNRQIGVKTTGHSLGAAASQIAGLYIGDRYHDSDVDVEVFAFNSPKIANEAMADTYRNATSSCNFNLHIFNNSYDAVSKVPFPGHQIIGQADSIGSTDFERNTCIYHGKYRSSSDSSGLHLPSILHPLGSVISQGGQFALAQHNVKQWQINQPNTTLLAASNPVAASWFPMQPLGGITRPPFIERSTIRGPFKANVFAQSTQGYWNSLLGGGSFIDARTTVPLAFNLFEFEPTDTDCIRHGNTIRLRTWNSNNVLTAVNGDLNASAFLDEDQRSNVAEATLFELVNHTDKFDCIANNDRFSLKTHEGQYVTAEFNGALNSSSSNIGPQQIFEIRNMVETVRRLIAVEEAPSTSGHGIEAPYEAEEQKLLFGSQVASSHPGYSGRGFVDYTNDGNVVEFEVEVASAGQYSLQFRYANGSNENRSADLIVDYTLIRNMPFSPTGSWTNWEATPEYQVNLDAGKNLVAVVATSGGPNLDNLVVNKVESCQPSAAIATAKTSTRVTHDFTTVSYEGLGLGGYPLVFPAMQSFNGKDTAHVRIDMSTTDDVVNVKIEEEQSDDLEIAHTREAVGFLFMRTQGHFLRNAAGKVIGEGFFSVLDHNWKTEQLLHNYENPVVIAHSETYNGSQPAHVRINNVNSNSVQLQMEEWDYLDGEHVAEIVSVMVIEAGAHTLRDGQKIVAGVQDVHQNARDQFSVFTFPEHFSAAPVVVSQVQSENGTDPMVTRMRAINSRSFEVLVQEEEAKDNMHANETIGFVAVQGNSRLNSCD